MPDTVTSIEQAAQVARANHDRQRVYLGTTPDRVPLWSWLGTVIADPSARRPPAAPTSTQGTTAS